MAKTIKKNIYLDHAAATPLDADVEKAMRPYWAKEYANPSALHHGGVLAREAVEKARKSVAGVLRCQASEIVFVPGGTAGNNLALLGVARAFRPPPRPPLGKGRGAGMLLFRLLSMNRCLNLCGSSRKKVLR